MDETNQPVNQNPTPPATNQKLVTPEARNYFWIALAVLLFGGVVIIGISMWAGSQNGGPSTNPSKTATTGAQIKSRVDLDKATQQLDNADFTSIQNGLKQNDQAATSF